MPNESWTVDGSVVYQQMDGEHVLGRQHRAVRAASWRVGALPRREPRRRVDAGRVDAAGRPRIRASSRRRPAISRAGSPTHQDNTDYTFYLSNAFGVYYANYDLGPDPRGLGWSDSRDFADRIAQEFRLQGSTEKTTWIAGPLLRDASRTATTSSRASRTTRTRRRLPSGIRYYGVRAGHDRQRLLPLEERPDHRAVSPSSARSSYSPNERLDADGRPALVRPYAQARHISSSPRTATSPRTSAPPRRRPATSPRSSRCSTTSPTTRWCTRSTPTVSAPAGAMSFAPARSLPPDYEPDFLDNYELGFKSRWLGGRVRAEPDRVPDGLGGLPGRGRRPGPALRGAGRERRRRRDRGPQPRFLRATSGIRSTFGLNAAAPRPDRPRRTSPILGTACRGTRLPFSAEEKGAVWARIHLPRRVRAAASSTRALPVELQRVTR